MSRMYECINDTLVAFSISQNNLERTMAQMSMLEDDNVSELSYQYSQITAINWRTTTELIEAQDKDLRNVLQYVKEMDFEELPKIFEVIKYRINVKNRQEIDEKGFTLALKPCQKCRKTKTIAAFEWRDMKPCDNCMNPDHQRQIRAKKADKAAAAVKCAEKRAAARKLLAEEGNDDETVETVVFL